jgi:hypothetical protein
MHACTLELPADISLKNDAMAENCGRSNGSSFQHSCIIE